MISFILPTIGRASLGAALASIAPEPGDEILVVGAPALLLGGGAARAIPCPPGHDFGCRERTLAIAHARGDYLAFLDDDDTYTPGARALMGRVIRETPGRPVLFRMAYPSGATLWADPVLRVANVSTQMILIPNDRARLGTWTPRREGDYDFLASMTWPAEAIVWREELIARLGHNDDGYPREAPPDA